MFLARQIDKFLTIQTDEEMLLFSAVRLGVVCTERTLSVGLKHESTRYSTILTDRNRLFRVLLQSSDGI
jgi:hypothetical protein